MGALEILIYQKKVCSVIDFNNTMAMKLIKKKRKPFSFRTFSTKLTKTFFKRKNLNIVGFGTIAFIGAPTTLKRAFIESVSQGTQMKIIDSSSIIHEEAYLQSCNLTRRRINSPSPMGIKFMLLDIDIALKLITPISYKANLLNSDTLLFFALKGSNELNFVTEIKEIISLVNFKNIPVVVVTDDRDFSKKLFKLNVKVCDLSNLNVHKKNTIERMTASEDMLTNFLVQTLHESIKKREEEDDEEHFLYGL